MRLILLSLVIGLCIVLMVPTASATLPRETRTLYRINDARQAYNVRTVRRGICVDRFAEHWTRYLINHGGTLRHQSMLPIISHCQGVSAGEIISLGYKHPIDEVRNWLVSPDHSRVMLDSAWDHAGVGSVKQPDGRWLTVVDFICHKNCGQPILVLH